MLIDPADLAPLDAAKAASALERVRLEVVTDPEGPAFDACYRMLDGFFGPHGELEEREALENFVRDPVIPYAPGLEGVYHLVAAWEGDRLVGVRDCYVDIDHVAGVCVVALSHAYVVPEWRRAGLAAVLRALPITLSRPVLAERAGRPLPTLVAAEMEPVNPDVPETVVRLLAYGRSGFSVLDPRRFRYSQPDFRAGQAHTGIALLGVVRPVGLPTDALPVEIVAAYPRLFHVCHRMYLPAERVDPSERHAMATLAASDAPVPLLPLPTRVEELERLAPLMRGAVLPGYPIGLRGPDPTFGDPAEELAAVLRRFRP